MLNCDNDAFLAARAIQFFVPGVPQVYYDGLLAGENDYEQAKLAGDGREINRHNYSLEEIEQSLGKPVVQRLIKLVKFRNELPAFNNKFNVLDSNSDEILMSWQKDDAKCTLFIDLKTNKSIISYVDERGIETDYLV